MDRERIAQVFFFGFLAFMAYELFLLLSPFIVPLTWAMLLAFISHPAMPWIERVVKRQTAAAMILTLALTLVIAVPTVWLSGRIAVEARSVGPFSTMVRTGGPAYFESGPIYTHVIEPISAMLERKGLSLTEIRRLMTQSTNWISAYVSANAASIARNLLSFVIDLGIMLFSFFYLVRDGESYYNTVRALTPMREEDKAFVFDTLTGMLSAVMRGLVLTAVLESVLIGGAYLVAGVPYWALLGVLTGAFGFMPIGGTALVFVPVALYLGFSTGWASAIALLIWSTITVVVVDNFIKPAAMGHGTDLPAVAIFLGITGGIEVYGFLGVFAGPAVIALFAALLRVYRRTYTTAAPPPTNIV